MNCYNHPEAAAVAICKSCARGLCHTCLTEVGKSTSCKNRCEAEVTIMNDLFQRGSTVYQKNSSTMFRSSLFIFLLGLIMLVIGILSSTRSGPNYLLLVIGLLFMAWSVSLFISAKRMGQK